MSSTSPLRFWRSTGLVGLLILVDVLVLLGGLSLPMLENLFWIKVNPYGSQGLWNPPLTHSLDAFTLLWWIRIMTVGKAVLSLGLAKYLYSYHTRQYSGKEESIDRIGKLFLIFACWHLIVSAVQIPTFWLAYLPLVKVTYWEQIGPAPLIAICGMTIEVFIIGLGLYYRKQRQEWNKLNKDLSVYF